MIHIKESKRNLIGEKISVCIAGAFLIPSRRQYLEIGLSSIVHCLPGAEILIGLDGDVYPPNLWEKQFNADVKIKVHNMGLGYSWNWAYEQSTREYILHTEEDWAILNQNDFEIAFQNAIKVIDEHGGIFRFDNGCQSYWKYGWKNKKIDNFKYYELNRPPNMNGFNLYYYSNRPHLKKSDLNKKLGISYPIQSVPPVVESSMCKQYWEKGKKVFCLDNSVIRHIGKESIRDIRHD